MHTYVFSLFGVCARRWEAISWTETKFEITSLIFKVSFKKARELFMITEEAHVALPHQKISGCPQGYYDSKQFRSHIVRLLLLLLRVCHTVEREKENEPFGVKYFLIRFRLRWRNLLRFQQSLFDSTENFNEFIQLIIRPTPAPSRRHFPK